MKNIILSLTVLFLVSCASSDRGPASNEAACSNDQFFNQQSYFIQYERCNNL